MRLTATETKVLASANYKGIICVVYSQSSSRRSNNSFGNRELKAARNLVKKGLLIHIPNTHPSESGTSTYQVK